MKICFVGPANSAHIVKWCNWFTEQGHEVHVISFTQGEILNTNVHILDNGVNSQGSDIEKLKYLLMGKRIREQIRRIKPDIINAHYATSYGMTMALSRVNTYIVSVWGSDIYEFPNKSFFHKQLLKYSLRRASKLFSTSYAMAEEAKKYTKKKFEITPFGVDMKLFNPCKRNRREEEAEFIVGTVKTMSYNYGIDTIIDAIQILINKRPDIPIKVRLAGDGPELESYKSKVKHLQMSEIITFLGHIPQNEAAQEWANMDIAIIPSLQESFGVAAIEAQASGIPVIISNAPGLVETTIPGETSLMVKAGDAEAIEQAIELLYDDRELLHKMKICARKYAMENYDINHCFRAIETQYINFLGEEKY